MEPFGIALIGLGFFAGPLALPLLIGAVWAGRWSLWAVGSLLFLWGATGWGLLVAQFAAIDSVAAANQTFQETLAAAGATSALCAAGVRLRQRG